MSKLVTAAIETAGDLHHAGIMDEVTVREFDALKSDHLEKGCIPDFINAYKLDVRDTLNDWGKSLYEKHNCYVDWVLTLLYFSTGHSPVDDPFCYSRQISLEDGWCLIDDKTEEGKRQFRVTPLSKTAVTQLQHYYSHLRQLSSRLSRRKESLSLASLIQSVLDCPEQPGLPLFFYLNKQDQTIKASRVEASNVHEKWEKYIELPSNEEKKLLASSLVRNDVEPELIAIFLGHEYARKSYFNYLSRWSLKEAMNNIAPEIDSIQSSWGFQAIPGFLRNKKADNKKLKTPKIAKAFEFGPKQGEQTNKESLPFGKVHGGLVAEYRAFINARETFLQLMANCNFSDLSKDEKLAFMGIGAVLLDYLVNKQVVQQMVKDTPKSIFRIGEIVVGDFFSDESERSYANPPLYRWVPSGLSRALLLQIISDRDLNGTVETKKVIQTQKSILKQLFPGISLAGDRENHFFRIARSGLFIDKHPLIRACYDLDSGYTPLSAITMARVINRNKPENWFYSDTDNNSLAWPKNTKRTFKKERSGENYKRLYGEPGPTRKADVNILSSMEYKNALSRLVDTPGNAPFYDCQLGFCLIMGYQFGLSVDETFRLLTKHVRFNEALTDIQLSLGENVCSDEKNESFSRTIPLIFELEGHEKAILKRVFNSAQTQRREGGGLVFLMAQEGKSRELIDKKQVSNQLNNCLESVTGDKSVNIHHLSHTWATSIGALLIDAIDGKTSFFVERLQEGKVAYQSQFKRLFDPAKTNTASLKKMAIFIGNHLHCSEYGQSVYALPNKKTLVRDASAQVLNLSGASIRKRYSRFNIESETIFPLTKREFKCFPELKIEKEISSFQGEPKDTEQEETNKKVSLVILNRILIDYQWVGEDLTDYTAGHGLKKEKIQTILKKARKLERQSGYGAYQLDGDRCQEKGRKTALTNLTENKRLRHHLSSLDNSDNGKGLQPDQVLENFTELWVWGYCPEKSYFILTEPDEIKTVKEGLALLGIDGFLEIIVGDYDKKESLEKLGSFRSVNAEIKVLSSFSCNRMKYGPSEKETAFGVRLVGLPLNTKTMQTFHRLMFLISIYQTLEHLYDN